MENGKAKQRSLHRNSANALVDFDESALKLQIFAQGRLFGSRHIYEIGVHLLGRILQWSRAVTRRRIFEIEGNLLQFKVLDALRKITRGPKHLNEHSQRARTQDEFAALEKEQPHLQAAGI